MTAEQVIRAVEESGGWFEQEGESILVRRAPKKLVPALRELKPAVVELLRQRENSKLIADGAPAMPSGVRLLHWEPKAPPVLLTSYSVVNDVGKFISYTLAQLEAALAGKNWQAGNWTVRALVERLEQCGVTVEVSQ